MNKKMKLKIMLYLNVFLLMVLIIYKGYLYIYESDFESKNLLNIKKTEKIISNDYSFAVLGNIENSIQLFDKNIIDELNNDKDIDFIISTGDSVLDGAEDKYRILNKSINKINKPVIIGIGDNEISDNGGAKFYKHFGPYYFSFNLEDSYFIFLDTTGTTSYEWQKEWLLKELEISKDYKYKFVFMNKAPYKFEIKTILQKKSNYIKDEEFCEFLNSTFEKYRVTSVFSSFPGIYAEKEINNVKYFISGGAGGDLLPNNSNSFYHYISVKVNNAGVSYEVVKQKITAKYPITRFLENLWITIHSIFYINFVNFIIILITLILISIAIYKKASNDVDYYRDFTKQRVKLDNKKSLKIAMFTNNYLPFIGGVPISIDRLAKSLRKRGHEVIIFAPDYPDLEYEENIYIKRFKLLKYLDTGNYKFPIINIFSRAIENEFNCYNFDIVHVHHPFWMGTKGLKLSKKNNLPVVLTYHTRLELYSHLLPFLKLVFKNIISHKLIKRFAQKCNGIISPTYSAKDYLNNINVSRQKYVIPTGVDFDSYVNIDKKEISSIRNDFLMKEEFLLCSVSRLSKEKNIFFLLRAIKYIKKNTSISFKCIIIGDGPDKDEIKAYIKNEALEDTILLTGLISPTEVSKYYLASDLFVFSSLSETQGIVILEAMAGKCPVVAVRSSGIDDIVKNNYNGFKTHEDIVDWSNKVIEIIENKELLEKLSANAYELAKKFSLEQVAIKTEIAYFRSIEEMKNNNK